MGSRSSRGGDGNLLHRPDYRIAAAALCPPPPICPSSIGGHVPPHEEGDPQPLGGARPRHQRALDGLPGGHLPHRGGRWSWWCRGDTGGVGWCDVAMQEGGSRERMTAFPAAAAAASIAVLPCPFARPAVRAEEGRVGVQQGGAGGAAGLQATRAQLPLVRRAAAGRLPAPRADYRWRRRRRVAPPVRRCWGGDGGGGVAVHV